ncbi:hypothetical protein [Desulfobotulus mexicanus]|uniref:DUF2116 family Zn-ribbon domain-containing protein n=1 Tax=Desulfobotulus mexicanus TaxID=2586642 RepID=A0A5Q4VDV3_9BACT|nr:hypothetical protein [Desulfobotulus mexicanus]TYT75143.1 hypothetical protein FIM25_05350 [Desulfobotulus mexicanus]
MIDRLIMLRQQLRSKQPKQCRRCGLSYEDSKMNCPHCSGLSERELEELVRRKKAMIRGNVLHMLFVFAALAVFFILFFWLLG